MSILIASQSTPDLAYRLNLDPANGRVTCTCMAFRFSKGPAAKQRCKHVRQLAELLANQLAD